MLESFTLDTFAGLVGDTFTVEVDGGAPFDATLTETTQLGPAGSPSGRAPFSLLFVGEVHAPQAIYRLSHRDVGTFELFLVPIGPDDDGMRYEAVLT